MENKVKFIDLFAGLGGIRLGFEKAFNELGLETKCVLTSEIKPYATRTLQHNFSHENFVGNIFGVKSEDIPDFDFLLGGFPCQPFSNSGRRNGFADTRGTLFFEIERILKEKSPYGFILENVEGLVKHDLENKSSKIGKTLNTILHKLENELHYKVSWKVLDSKDFGLPQSRKRIFIVGTKYQEIDLNNFPIHRRNLKAVLENGKTTLDTPFVHNLLSHFEIEDLYGKSIKDKRGGENNIHSWDIGLKGEVSDDQILLLNSLFKQRRKKQWAVEIGIDWMDGMPLTAKQIGTFYNSDKLQSMLDDLVEKKYLRFEHPKKITEEFTLNGPVKKRVYDFTKPKGYNIVTGKLSFDINKILDPNDIAPTLVATDVSKLVVPDGRGLRKLTIREGLRLFGYPERYEIPVKENDAFDLLGNTVAVPIIEAISFKLSKKFEMEKAKEKCSEKKEHLLVN